MASFTIKPILHDRINADGTQKLMIRVIYQRMKAYASTLFRIKADQFNGTEIINHKQHVRMNAMLRKQISEIEERMLEQMVEQMDLATLKEIVGGEKKSRMDLVAFVQQYLHEQKNRFSKETQKAYKTVYLYLDQQPSIDVHQISTKWLKKVEDDLFAKELDQNTIRKRMTIIISFLNAAAAKSMLKKEQYADYTPPRLIHKIPEYINEAEMEAFKNICDVIQKPKAKLSGYYFLLACYAGYRISDLKRFKYDEMVRDNRIILKAKKNGSIISMPIHSRLAAVLDYCKEHPLVGIAEQNMREYVKEIAGMAGIGRKIKVHTARHSFAMMLMDNDFSLEDVAELLGNTMKSTQIYARVSNQRLSQKIMEKLG